MVVDFSDQRVRLAGMSMRTVFFSGTLAVLAGSAVHAQAPAFSTLPDTEWLSAAACTVANGVPPSEVPECLTNVAEVQWTCNATEGTGNMVRGHGMACALGCFRSHAS
jgi:hypothetical protein